MREIVDVRIWEEFARRVRTTAPLVSIQSAPLVSIQKIPLFTTYIATKTFTNVESSIYILEIDRIVEE